MQATTLDRDFATKFENNNPPGLYYQYFNGNIVHNYGSINALDSYVKSTFLPVISLKGWGSGIEQSDLDALGGETAIIQEAVNILSGIPQFFIQWDGDNIEPGVFTRFIIPLTMALNRQIAGFIAIKEVKPKKMPEINANPATWIGITEMKLLDLSRLKPILVGLTPLKEDPADAASGYGIWGAILNMLFKPIGIIYFGGGDVVNKEFKHPFFNKGVDYNFCNLTRKGGKDRSTIDTYIKTFRQSGHLGFGKKRKSSKIPASIKNKCIRLKIKLTRRVNNKRVYKTLAALKKQIKSKSK
jgi:hypothetical protein